MAITPKERYFIGYSGNQLRCSDGILKANDLGAERGHFR
jgi:hypothetical protein